MTRLTLMDIILALEQTINNIGEQNYDSQFYLSVAARNLTRMREELLDNLENNLEPTGQRLTEITNVHAVVARAFANTMYFHDLVHQPHPYDPPLQDGDNHPQEDNYFNSDNPYNPQYELPGQNIPPSAYMAAFGCG